MNALIDIKTTETRSHDQTKSNRPVQRPISSEPHKHAASIKKTDKPISSTVKNKLLRHLTTLFCLSVAPLSSLQFYSLTTCKNPDFYRKAKDLLKDTNFDDPFILNFSLSMISVSTDPVTGKKAECSLRTMYSILYQAGIYEEFGLKPKNAAQSALIESIQSKQYPHQYYPLIAIHGQELPPKLSRGELFLNRSLIFSSPAALGNGHYGAYQLVLIANESTQLPNCYPTPTINKNENDLLCNGEGWKIYPNTSTSIPVDNCDYNNSYLELLGDRRSIQPGMNYSEYKAEKRRFSQSIQKRIDPYLQNILGPIESKIALSLIYVCPLPSLPRHIQTLFRYRDDITNETTLFTDSKFSPPPKKRLKQPLFVSFFTQ